MMMKWYDYDDDDDNDDDDDYDDDDDMMNTSPTTDLKCLWFSICIEFH